MEKCNEKFLNFYIDNLIFKEIKNDLSNDK